MSNASESSSNGDGRTINIHDNGRYTGRDDNSTETRNFGPVNYIGNPNNGDTTSGTSRNHQSTHHPSRTSENTQVQPPRDPPYPSNPQIAPQITAGRPGDPNVDWYRPRQRRPPAQSPPVTPGSGLNNVPNLEAEVRQMSPEMLEYVKSLEIRAGVQGFASHADSDLSTNVERGLNSSLPRPVGSENLGRSQQGMPALFNSHVEHSTARLDSPDCESTTLDDET